MGRIRVRELSLWEGEGWGSSVYGKEKGKGALFMGTEKSKGALFMGRRKVRKLSLWEEERRGNSVYGKKKDEETQFMGRWKVRKLSLWEGERWWSSIYGKEKGGRGEEGSGIEGAFILFNKLGKGEESVDYSKTREWLNETPLIWAGEPGGREYLMFYCLFTKNIFIWNISPSDLWKKSSLHIFPGDFAQWTFSHHK